MIIPIDNNTRIKQGTLTQDPVYIIQKKKKLFFIPMWHNEKFTFQANHESLNSAITYLKEGKGEKMLPKNGRV